MYYRKFLSTIEIFYMIKTGGVLHCLLLDNNFLFTVTSLYSHSVCCRELELVMNKWGRFLPKKKIRIDDQLVTKSEALK